MGTLSKCHSFLTPFLYPTVCSPVSAMMVLSSG